jgi:hypothetical protein
MCDKCVSIIITNTTTTVITIMIITNTSRYDLQVEVLSMHKQALLQQVAFLQAELHQLRSKIQRQPRPAMPSPAASIDWAPSPLPHSPAKFVQHAPPWSKPLIV